MVQSAKKKSCPRCSGPLMRLSCDQCHGKFFTKRQFIEGLRNPALLFDNPYRGTPIERVDLNYQDPVAYLKCPYCSDTMIRTKAFKDLAVVVDICPKHGVFLDHQELVALQQMVNQINQEDRLSDHFTEVMRSLAKRMEEDA